MNNCPVCRLGNLAPERVETWMHREGRWVLFTGVPALVCDACGETTFEQEVAARLSEVLSPDSDEVPTGARWCPEYNLETLDMWRAAGGRPPTVSGTAALDLHPTIVDNKAPPVFA